MDKEEEGFRGSTLGRPRDGEKEDGTGSLSWSARMKNMICCFGSDSIERYEGSDDGRDGRSALECVDGLSQSWVRSMRRMWEEDLDFGFGRDIGAFVISAGSVCGFVIPVEEGRVIGCIRVEEANVDEFLKAVGERFEVVVFTASEFIDDMEDEELLDCLDTLLALEHAPDVRPTLAAVLQRKDIVVFGGYT
eukprot:jgi/Picre1/32060/NNA_007408.t1